VGHVVVENFREGCVLEFAPGPSVLASVEEMIVNAVVHCATTKEKVNGEV
jgi:hypothetical protein